MVSRTGTLRDASIDDEALQSLAREGSARGLPPVAFVIAAYNEEGAIGAVVDNLPKTVCGLPATAVVVVDGADDRTAEEARSRGAIVCDVPTRRGQGAALRLGYRIAREGGAQYIVTTDADGQYDPAEAERVLEPVVSGDADFVSGSRVLGSDETTDPVRRLGVRVFAAAISLLTGNHITDPAFGLRAMRAEVTDRIELEQPQYQAAEVLIGVIARGFRAVERPATMRRRKASETKKGRNVMYALRFARVIGATWWREHRRTT
jgi:glycosyltransferase involved in cell wall biosynthesis